MNKTKQTIEEIFSEHGIKFEFDEEKRCVIADLYELLLQDRTQRDTELREKIENLDQYAEVTVSTDTVIELLSRPDVLSLLESKEESCDCECHDKSLDDEEKCNICSG